MKKLSEINWHRIASPNDQLDFSDPGSVFVYRDNVLISNHNRKIIFWDMSKPRNLVKISEVELSSQPRIKILDNFLYAFCERGIEKIDISNLHDLRSTKLVSWEKRQHERSGCIVNGKLYISYEN